MDDLKQKLDELERRIVRLESKLNGLNKQKKSDDLHILMPEDLVIGSPWKEI